MRIMLYGRRRTHACASLFSPSHAPVCCLTTHHGSTGAFTDTPNDSAVAVGLVPRPVKRRPSFQPGSLYGEDVPVCAVVLSFLSQVAEGHAEPRDGAYEPPGTRQERERFNPAAREGL